jgi:hypothetical protein
VLKQAVCRGKAGGRLCVLRYSTKRSEDVLAHRG